MFKIELVWMQSILSSSHLFCKLVLPLCKGENKDKYGENKSDSFQTG